MVREMLSTVVLFAFMVLFYVWWTVCKLVLFPILLIGSALMAIMEKDWTELQMPFKFLIFSWEIPSVN